MKKNLIKKLKLLLDDFDSIELIKGSFKSLTSKVLGMTFGFLMILFISNKYGAEELGLFSLSLTILNVAVLLPKFGFEQALVRILGEIKIKGNRNDFFTVLKKSTKLSFFLSLIVSVFLYLTAEYFAINVFKNAELFPYIKCVVLAIPPTTLLVIVSGTFQSLKKTFHHILYKTAFVNIIFTIFLILNYYIVKKYDETFIIYTYAIYFVFFFGVIDLKKTISSHKFAMNKSLHPETRMIVKTSIPMLYSGSLALLIGWSNILLLGFFINEYEVGIYYSLERIASLSSVGLIAINSIVAPKFSEAYAKQNYIELKGVTRKSTKMIFLITTPVLIVLSIFGKQILQVFGSEFVVGYWALVIMCFSKFIGAVSGSVGYLLQMTGRQKKYSNIMFLTFLSNITLDIILIPKYGYLGAVIAGSFAIIFSNVASAIVVKKELGFWSFYFPFIIK